VTSLAIAVMAKYWWPLMVGVAKAGGTMAGGGL